MHVNLVDGCQGFSCQEWCESGVDDDARDWMVAGWERTSQCVMIRSELAVPQASKIVGGIEYVGADQRWGGSFS